MTVTPIGNAGQDFGYIGTYQLTVPVTAGVLAGNTVIIAFAVGTNSVATDTVTDTSGNTYVNDAVFYNSNYTRTLVFSSQITTPLTTSSSIFINSTLAADIFASAVSVDSLVVKDQSATAGTTVSGPGTLSIGPTGTAVQSDELLLAAFGLDFPNSGTTTFSPESGWTAIPSNALSGFYGLYPEYQIVSETGIYSATATIGTNVLDWSGALVTYKAAPPPATKLAFTAQPQNTQAGITMSAVSVQVEDGSGNPVADSGVAVTLTVNTGSFSSGTNPVNTDSTGKATFGDLAINSVGTYHISAAASGLTGVESDSFEITPIPVPPIPPTPPPPPFVPPIPEGCTDYPVTAFSSEKSNSPATGLCLGVTGPNCDLPGTNYSSDFADDCNFGPFSCMCAGGQFTQIACAISYIGPWTWNVSGTLPPGIRAYPNFPAPNQLLLSGTAETSGLYSFTLTVKDGSGNIQTFDGQINVIQIITTSVPKAVSGHPYSFQLEAHGGTGVLLWKIANGTLPAGLVMNEQGLIFGTPTESGPVSCTFFVEDSACVPNPETFTQASIAVSGVQTIQTLTWKGFNGFQTNTRYKTCAMSGAGEFLLPPNTTEYYYCGQTSIDTNGNPVSGQDRHCSYYVLGGGQHLTISLPCVTVTNVNASRYGDDVFGFPSPIDWSIASAGSSIRDVWFPISGEGGYTNILSDTLAVCSRNESVGGGVALVDRTVTLSDPYTDSEALATASTVTQPGLVAANIARGSGYVAYQVTLAYTLTAVNLIVGSSYTATVQWIDVSGNVTVKSYPFTATSVTQTINDSVPLPASGDLVIVTNPYIAQN